MFIIGMFFQKAKKMVHDDAAHVGQMAAKKKKANTFCFRSRQLINTLISNSHVCHEDFYNEVI